MSPYALPGLPFELQVALVVGYSVYSVVFFGIRRKHAAYDLILLSLLFSCIFAVLHRPLVPYGPIVSYGTAAINTLLIGVFWRKFARNYLLKYIRAIDGSRADNSDTALQSALERSSEAVTQISVYLEDGSIIGCDDTSAFNDETFAPCLIGPDGSVVLYADYEETSGGKRTDFANTTNEDFGALATYVPGNRVKSLNIRFD